MYVLKAHQIAAIVSVVSLLTVFIPFTLPLPIDSKTIAFYNQIEKLPPGSKVLFGYAATYTYYLSHRDVFRAIIYHCARKNLTLLWYNFEKEGPAASLSIFSYANPEAKFPYWKYGKNYVIFSLLVGEEDAMAALASNMRILETDIYGNSIDDLPAMDGVKTLKDIDLCIVYYETYTWPYMFIRQWPVKYNVPLIDATAFPPVSAYYNPDTGPVYGVLDSDRGQAEYELITGFFGEQIIRMKLRGTAGLTIAVVLLVLGNITDYINKRKQMEGGE